jgi:hypothetical protein
MRKTSRVAVLTVLALSLSGCGGGDDAKASKSIADSVMSTSSSGATSLVKVKRKDADCIGHGLVDRIGVDRLRAYTLLDENLQARNDITQVKMSATDARSATDVFFRCTDMRALVRRALSSAGTVSADMRACIDRTLTDKNLRAFLSLTLQGNSTQAQNLLTDPMAKCPKGDFG